MIIFLQSQNCWEVVENRLTKLYLVDIKETTNNHRNIILENRKKDENALWYLHNRVEDQVFPKIAVVGHVQQTWKILKKIYQGIDKVENAKLQKLRKSFEALHMKDK